MEEEIDRERLSWELVRASTVSYSLDGKEKLRELGGKALAARLALVGLSTRLTNCGLVLVDITLDYAAPRGARHAHVLEACRLAGLTLGTGQKVHMEVPFYFYVRYERTDTAARDALRYRFERWDGRTHPGAVFPDDVHPSVGLGLWRLP